MKKILLTLLGILGFTLSMNAQCSVSVDDSLLANYDLSLAAINPVGTAPFTYTWTITDGNGMTIPFTTNIAGDSALINSSILVNSYGCIIYSLCMTDAASCTTCIADTANANLGSLQCYSQFTSNIIAPNQVSVTVTSTIPPYIILNQFITWTDGNGVGQGAPYTGPNTIINYVPGPANTDVKFFCCVMTNTINGGCIVCDSIPYTALGVANYTAQKQVHISPNPASSILTIDSPSPINKIEILNLLGQTMAFESIITKTNATLQINTLRNGVYIVRVYTESGMIEKRIIKE